MNPRAFSFCLYDHRAYINFPCQLFEGLWKHLSSQSLTFMRTGCKVILLSVHIGVCQKIIIFCVTPDLTDLMSKEKSEVQEE